MNREKTLKERLEISYISRTEDLRKLFEHVSCEYDYICQVNEDLEECPIVQELGLFNEYGLSFDYVEEYTFNDQEEPYFRYQISWGGPSEEYRIYTDEFYTIKRIEYWFLDWFEGEYKTLDYDDIMFDIIQDFRDMDLLRHAKERALETAEEQRQREEKETAGRERWHKIKVDIAKQIKEEEIKEELAEWESALINELGERVGPFDVKLTKEQHEEVQRLLKIKEAELRA